MGGDVIRRAAILELVQSGRDKSSREVLPTTATYGKKLELSTYVKSVSFCTKKLELPP